MALGVYSVSTSIVSAVVVAERKDVQWMVTYLAMGNHENVRACLIGWATLDEQSRVVCASRKVPE